MWVSTYWDRGANERGYSRCGSILIGTGVLMSEAIVGVGQYLLGQGC